MLGGVPARALLTRNDLVSSENAHGGIIIVGWHVNKTTRQLDEAKNCKYPIAFIEFNQHLVLEKGGLDRAKSRG